MKQLFNDISLEEKNRIMEMHKTASDNLYLNEQDLITTSRPTNQPPQKSITTSRPTNQPPQKSITTSKPTNQTPQLKSVNDPKTDYDFIDVNGKMYIILKRGQTCPPGEECLQHVDK
jgi:hypothetical protein